jgi:hypothetical protein
MRLALLFFPALLAAQHLAEPVPAVSTAATVPVDIIINWPPLKLVEQKYGRLPQWAKFAEVVGCNRGDSNITYTVGDMIAAIRTAAGIQVFSPQDALSLVGNSQSTSRKNIITGWLKAGASSVVDAKAIGLIGAGVGTGAGIVVGAEFINIILPNVQANLTLKQLIAYQADGIPVMMQMQAGRCAGPYSVLSAVPAVPTSPTAPPHTYSINVPKDR